MFFKFISFLLIIVAGIFIFQNLDEVTVTFTSVSFTGPLALSISLAVLCGFIIGVFFMLPGMFRRRREIKVLRKNNAALQKEVNDSSIDFNPGNDTPADREAYGESIMS